MQNLFSLSISEDRAKEDIEILDPIQALKLASSLLSKAIEYNFEIQCSLDDAKAEETMALDKTNAKREKPKELEKELSATQEKIESMLDLGYGEYLKGLNDCHMFFACYNDNDIKV
ncbi:hypothetical protein WN944_018747 [Citrus x changshan-huyou]|uniref:Uncharacterized protein n=1 Tax=Citrus x changshan-huyou TaxID=2935761 RepID=A0AAP0QF48_9ROSI